MIAKTDSLSNDYLRNPLLSFLDVSVKKLLINEKRLI